MKSVNIKDILSLLIERLGNIEYGHWNPADK